MEKWGGLLLSVPSFAASSLVVVAGVATTAIGAAELEISWSLMLNAKDNFDKDLKSLQAAIDDAKASGGSKEGTSKAANKVDGLAKEMKDWLGKDAKVITNKSGDKVFMSSDGTRRIRFDINNTSPHSNPHGHVEQLVNGKWVKSGPLYPVDVPQN